MKRIAPLVFAAVTALIACEGYVAPPQPSLIGIQQGGLLTDARAPLGVDFGVAIDPSTLHAKVAFNETDIEGNLPDEDEDPDTVLRVLDTRPVVEGARVTLNHDAAFPVGPKLVLIVEPGLTSTSGEKLNYRAKIPFSYTVACNGGPTRLASGKYFMLLEVDIGLRVQLQIFADLTVEAATGVIHGRFTSGQRRTDQKCPNACSNGEVCRLLPGAQCVLPSTSAGTVDEYPDYYANPNPPTGYEFLAEGCAADNETGTGVLMAPTTLTVQSPPVTANGLGLSAIFEKGPDNVTRANGSLTADSIVLGTAEPITTGKGTMTARTVP